MHEQTGMEMPTHRHMAIHFFYIRREEEEGVEETEAYAVRIVRHDARNDWKWHNL